METEDGNEGIAVSKGRASSWVWRESDWRVKKRRSRVAVRHTETRIEVVWSAEALVEEGGRLLPGYRMKVRLEPGQSSEEERGFGGKQVYK